MFKLNFTVSSLVDKKKIIVHKEYMYMESLMLHTKIKKKKKGKNKRVSGVGFEPTPTYVDYDLNVAP